MPRRAAALPLALAAALSLSACASPAPTPSESPSAATEAEAFAAAEATYRAYVDALNAVDLSDPATFEPVYAWTTGDANSGARESFSQMHADGWTVDGTSVVGSFSRLSPNEKGNVSLIACLDVSSVTLTDLSGTSMVSPDRPAVQVVRVDTVVSPLSNTGMLISRLDGYENGSVCN